LAHLASSAPPLCALQEQQHFPFMKETPQLANIR
jgi:hypothetical protein